MTDVIVIPPDRLSNIFINERPAVEVARQGSSPALGPRDLQDLFKIGRGDANRVMEYLAKQLEWRWRPNQVISIRFDHLPVVQATGCQNGKEFDPLHPQRSCLVVDASRDYARAFPLENWNPQVHDRITRWLKQLELYRPETLAVFTDLDHTVWAGDVADAVFEAAVKEYEGRPPVVSWKNAPVLPDFPKKAGQTPFDYYHDLYGQNPLVAYNYAAQAFAGLTLREAHEAFLRAKQLGLLPRPYPELKKLFGFLWGRGMTVGYVSASPIFLILPMLEEAGYRVRADGVEGIDPYVTDPDQPGREVLLSRLIQREPPLLSWGEFLARYGDRVRLTGHVSELINAREGKGAAARAIVARRVRGWHHPYPSELLREGDIRMAAAFGDNWGPFRGGLRDELAGVGNDQGLLRAVPPIPGALVVDIHRAVGSPTGIDLERRRKNLDNFRQMQAEIGETLGHRLRFLVQIGISAGEMWVGDFYNGDVP